MIKAFRRKPETDQDTGPEVMQEKRNRGGRPTYAVSEPGGQTQPSNQRLSVCLPVLETSVLNVRKMSLFLKGQKEKHPYSELFKGRLSLL